MSHHPSTAATTRFTPSPSRMQAQAAGSRTRSPNPTSLPARILGQAMVQAASMGSQTQTQTSIPAEADVEQTAVLRLRGEHEPGTTRTIHWAEDVVDNEGLGRKSSKVCCIYHAPKAVGESSSEDDSSSGSESDGSSSGADDGAARMVGGGRNKKRKGRGRERAHGPDHGEHGHECGDGSGHKAKRRPSPNAYEKIPKRNARRHVKR